MRRFMALLDSRRELAAIAPVMLYETLGRTYPDGSGAAAPLWLAAHRLAAEQPDAVRAAGIASEGFALGEALFEKVLTGHSGVGFSTHTYDQVWSLVKHEDGKIHLTIPRLLDWLKSLDPTQEATDPAYPFTLIAGQGRSYNANQIIRTPAWRKNDRDGALHIHHHKNVAVRLIPLNGAEAERAEALSRRTRLVEAAPFA